LQPLLEKLQEINPLRHNEIIDSINKEFKDEVAIKYEYWLDCPFRTKKIDSAPINNNEVGFLDFIYNNAKEADKQ
jgi:hypothetical protein